MFRKASAPRPTFSSAAASFARLACLTSVSHREYVDHVVVRHSARASVRELLSKSERVGFGTGQLVRRGGIPLKLLATRSSDRFALARQRGVSERTVPVAGRTRSLAVRALHSLVLVATMAGALRGLVLPGPAPEAWARTSEADAL
jgi:hypothetical protein